ncbi:hypothetical protein ABZ379_12880 [Streptomyces canus]
MLTRLSLAADTVSRLRSQYAENTADTDDADDTVLHRHQQPLQGPRHS